MTRARGRLGYVPGGTLLRHAWQTLNRRLAVHGPVATGANFMVGTGAIVRSLHGLTIGDDVSVGRDCTIEVDGTIGSKCLFAAAVGVVGRADHAINEVGRAIVDSTWIGDRAELAADRIRIGDDVWVGYGAIILSGITVGDGAVIGAGAVVVRDVPPFAVVAGNPARQVGQRFDEAEGRQHLDMLRASALRDVKPQPQTGPSRSSSTAGRVLSRLRGVR